MVRQFVIQQDAGGTLNAPKSQARFPWMRAWVLGCVLFSMVMSAVLSRQVFERLPHLEDEVAYLWQGKLLASGQVVIPAPEPRRAFWQPFVVDYTDLDSGGATRFGKYTLGWPLFMSLGVLLGPVWIVNALLSGLTVALIYRLGREVFGADVGAIAAGLVAFSPMALLLNATLMGHTAALFTTTLFLFAYWRMTGAAAWGRRDGVEQKRTLAQAFGWGLVAGLALGLTVLNRPLAGLALGIPFIGWSAMWVVRAAWDERSDNELRTHPGRKGLTAKAQRTPSVQDFEPPERQERQIFQSSLQAGGVQAVEPSGGTVDKPVDDGRPLVRGRLLGALAPLLALAAVAGLLTLLIPFYNTLATGNPALNLYTLVWSYDRVGFGEGYGRNTHTLEKGLRQTRWDLSLTAADLFGWHLWLTRDASGALGLRPTLGADGQLDPELRQHLLTDGDYWSPLGLSLFLLLPGVWIGARGAPHARWLLLTWLALGAALAVWSVNRPPSDLQNPGFATGWMLAVGLWIVAPCGLVLCRLDARTAWVYLLLAVGLALVWLHVAYWIGSQRYSTRYYFEMLTGAAILTALPLATLGRLIGRRWLYAGLGLLLLGSLLTYSLPRIGVLYRFNWISPAVLEALEPLRDGRPLLVLVRGEDIRWRGLGPLMSVTHPLLNSDIVLALDNGVSDTRAAVLAQFPERQVIEMTGALNRVCLGAVMEAGACFGAPPGQ
jgi:hypothetical protein